MADRRVIYIEDEDYDWMNDKKYGMSFGNMEFRRMSDKPKEPMRINVNANSDMKAKDLQKGDLIEVYGSLGSVSCASEDDVDIDWPGTESGNVFSPGVVGVWLRGGMKVWREAQPKSAEFDGMVNGSKGTNVRYVEEIGHSLAELGFSCGTRVRVTVEEKNG